MKQYVYVFREDFKKEGKEFLKMENTSLFILKKKDVEVPVLIASTNIMISLGLFNESGRFDRQYIISFDKEAIKWGEELFEYYKSMGKEIEVK